ncbi:MAG TPA: hypothetical protein PK906_16065 [Spirochaetota bacterium]|nr:hypothetical protein [Spirochaetota bacterium]
MQKRKFYTIIILLVLAAGVALTTTMCYDDNDKDARVTIHLERNDIAYMGIQPEKHFIDRILEFFSTRAEAGGWDDDRTDLTLTVTSDSFYDLTFALPSEAETFTTTVPSGNNITFTITNYFDTIGYGYQKGWGGHTTLNLGPGDQDIEIKMIPMTWITNVNPVQWYGLSQYITSYNLYKSTDENGPYSKIVSNTTLTSYTDNDVSAGHTYYYRVSVNNENGEGVLSDPVPRSL